jgi:hypothetical protein
MAKKYDNMTTDERIAYWNREREKAKQLRAEKINHLDLEQRKALVELHKYLNRVLDIALYPDMGGIRAVTAYDLQELADAKDVFVNQFNLGVD